jgi:hypothetical protein
MIHDLLQFALAHPVAVLVFSGTLGFLWLIAAFISVMPPLPEGAGWLKQWAFACAQIFGASLDKAGHTVLQTRYAKQVEQQLMESKATGSDASQAPAPPV